MQCVMALESGGAYDLRTAQLRIGTAAERSKQHCSHDGWERVGIRAWFAVARRRSNIEAGYSWPAVQ